MSTLRFMAIDAICQRGSIRDSDVATLRRAFALEPQLSPDDIEALFRAHNLARVSDPSWADFFIETITDYVVRELEPAGYITAAHAGWLIARVSSAGRVRSKTEHDLLLNVIDKARWVPESLVTFALMQIRDAVTTGEGPLRAAFGVDAGIITLAEVEQIRALLFAYGNEGPVAITQAEIDILLDIDVAIAGQASSSAHDANHPFDAWPTEAWRDLIEKCTASVVLSASDYAGPSREEILNEARALFVPANWTIIASEQIRTGRISLLPSTQGSLTSDYRPLTAEARAIQRLELQRIEIITGEPVSTANAARLAARLTAKPLADGPAGRILDALAAAGVALAPELSGACLDNAFHAA